MINAYLGELADALRRLPASQRDHLVGEIREHIVEMRTERPVRDRSDMEALLNRVGLPEDIAAVALEGEEGEEEEFEAPVVAPLTPIAPAARYFGGRVSKRMLVGGMAAAVVVFGLLVGFAAIGAHRSTAFGIIERSSSAQPVFVRPALPPHVEQIAPDVIGESESQAESTMAAAGLFLTVRTTPSATVPAGQVISQSPASGRPVPRDFDVQILVSSGPASTTS